MLSEREQFDCWHSSNWKSTCANDDTLEDATKLYNRVYSHRDQNMERELEFKAWQASVNREGFKLVPINPSYDQIDALKNSCALFKNMHISDLEARRAYRDSIGVISV